MLKTANDANEHGATPGASPGRLNRARPLLRLRPSAQASLPPAALRLLDAARRLLERAGYGALTTEAIGQEAGEPKSQIHYHFGGKAGLLIALADLLFYETLWDMRARVSALPTGHERVEALADDLGRMIESASSYRLYYELLPHLMGSPRMRDQLADLYAAYRDLVGYALDVPPDDPRLSAFVSISIGMVDGLAIQRLCDSKGFELSDVKKVWVSAARALQSEGR